MNELLSNLDAMLESVSEESRSRDTPAQTVNKLIKTAKFLLEVADRVTDCDTAQGIMSIPAQSKLNSENMSELKIRRFQEMHVSPAIGKRISRSLYKIRRSRDNIFQEPEMFGEPAWDILLDLYISEREDRSVSITSACFAACVPPTTALRWISVLEAKGYVERTPDCLDARRHYVSLTDTARVMLNRFYADLVYRELI